MISLNIVAHPDDDLLFLAPDIADDLQQGGVAHILYLTYGDDGRDREYIEKRISGIWNAYLQIGELHEKVQLIYFDVKSNSFRNGDVYGDLYRLWQDELYMTRGAYNTPHVKNMLLTALRDQIERTSCDLIRIQDPFAEPAIDHDEPHLDHLDHIYSAKFALEAAKQFPHISVWSYMGYPIRSQEPNLTPEQIELKTKMWRVYQQYDPYSGGGAWDVALSRCYKEQIQ